MPLLCYSRFSFPTDSRSATFNASPTLRETGKQEKPERAVTLATRRTCGREPKVSTFSIGKHWLLFPHAAPPWPIMSSVHTFRCTTTFLQPDHGTPGAQVNWTVSARSGPCTCTCTCASLPSPLPPFCILILSRPLPTPPKQPPPPPPTHPTHLPSKQWSMTLSSRCERPHRRATLAAVSTGTPLQAAFCRMSRANGKMTRTKCAESI